MTASLKSYDITLVEVLVHRTTIEAAGIAEANELARELWDEEGTGCFHTETLGRTDLIVCDKAETEVRS
jgi:hypothetical protein